MTLHPDMTEATYRALPGLSGTGVSKLLKSPAMWRHEMRNPKPRTSSMALGTVFHALTLGEDPNVAISMFPDFRTRKAQDWKLDVEDAGMTVMTQADWDTARAMRDAVMANGDAAEILSRHGLSEIAITTEYRGNTMKGRCDRLVSAGPVVDLKSGKDITPEGMQRAMADYGYAPQLAHYDRIVSGTERPLLIAVANTAPHFVAVYRIDELTWDLAQRAVEKAWDLYADCMESGEWPTGLPDGVTDLGLKSWAYDELELRIDPDAFAEPELKL